MEKVYKNCQSCGMPLKKDEKGGGTNATDFIVNRLRLKAKGPMPAPFAAALETLTQQRFTNTADALQWWGLNGGTNGTNQADIQHLR